MTWPGLVRAVTTTAVTGALLAVVATTGAPTARDGPELVFDSLTVPDDIAPGQQVRASLRVHSTGGTLAVESITVAVRDARDGIADFPGARGATVTPAGVAHTSEPRSYPAGTYEAFVAYQVGGVWRDLGPHTTFTVAGPNPLTFAQEFDGPAGAGANHGLSRPVWTTDPCWSWESPCTNTPAQYRDANARLSGTGALVLTADRAPDAGARCGAEPCRFASSRLTTVDWADGGRSRWAQAGGHFEARIAMPAGRGLWPAFWTIGDQADSRWPYSGEIDIMEALGHEPRVVHQNMHSADPDVGAGADPHVLLAGGGGHTLPAGDVTGWHTYAIDWDPSPQGYVKWSVDGVHIRTITAAQAGRLWEPFRHPHSLILNLAVGGDWPGPPDAATRFPAQMHVDWIRVHRYPVV